MIKLVIKRNGAYHPYLSFKIEDAIQKAFQGQKQKTDIHVLNAVFKKLEEKSIWAVEDIQDIIEKELFDKHHFETMRAFMLHRNTRKMQR